MKSRSDLLIDSDELLILQTQLAVVFGDRHAIVLQQIHYWLNLNEKAKQTDHFFDAHWWAYNSWTDWQKNNFPFWSLNTVRRVFEDLSAEGLIVLRPHENQKNGMWVTLNYSQLEIHAKQQDKALKVRRLERHRGDVSKMETSGFQNGNSLSKMETYPAQIGQETREPETTTETNAEKKDSTGFATNPVRGKDVWRRNKVVIAPSTSVASSNEQTAYSTLELYLLKMLKRSSFTEAQRKMLAEEVVVRSLDGSTTEYSCPNELYDTDADFKRYVEKKVIETLNASNGKASATQLLKALANYTHAHGWLVYQSASHPVPPKTPEYSAPKAAAAVKTRERKGVF